MQFADSPFSNGRFSYFHLKTFEDHALDAAGVSARVFSGVAGVTSPFPVFDTMHNSVDADDVTIDHRGLPGDAYFASNGASGITLTFNANVLVALSSAVGLVWTDGSGHAVFTAYDAGNNILGTIGAVTVGDGSFLGGTDEDRFFGISGVGPLKRVLIARSGGGIEIGHLQYGLAAPVPEPDIHAMMLTGLGLTAILARRRKRKSTT